jgi:hypothetical protein
MKKDKIFRIALLENITKNVVILVILACVYNPIHTSLRSLDISIMSDFLLIISIFLVIVCFANFAFSYEHLVFESYKMRIILHFATFLFMLLIGFLLEAMVIAVSQVYPSLLTITILFTVLLYLGLATHDFWDFYRALCQKIEC